ncbi:hypothetical protein COY16_00490 [Candidatus Roizmanbacteria bacterium CG_4_10_14_0_2_um_filter_39_13]|uniref:EfeO-type cupredoxin-like domain-containing protein n=1 Tax=Candidatus Roizmanbacteria bacterium CG_4_10_14_0_2_um_filter_39_13 TaxID=1974825 RepID=A0A2M7U1N5_9BACT|nr:MAG: hypothetical protein COY16_00490 [Candidatus Roizmanbacteria bacterium CG_4_10_14_0_2_um_filter_39_13]
MKLKLLSVLIVGFIIGFYTNALLMFKPPDVLLKYTEAQDFAEKTQNALENSKTSEVTVEFDGTQFTPDQVVTKIGKRVEIYNRSPDRPMELISDTDQLNTTRGYGESERFRTVLMEPGVYTITTKDVPTAKLVVTVETY